MVLIIPDDVVKESITPKQCINAVEYGFKLYAHNKTLLTHKIENGSEHIDEDRLQEIDARFTYDNGNKALNLYGAYVPGWGLGTKTLVAFETNPGKGERFIQAVITMLNPCTGKLEAIIDGSYLTALRTAAAAAVASRYLIRKDSKTLGILGTGLQARTHLLCHLAMHPFRRVLIWGRNNERLKNYIGEMSPQIGAPLIMCESPEAVCREADVICTTTRSKSPLFSTCVIRPGTHLNVAGPLRQGETEIPIKLVSSSKLFVDSKAKFKRMWHAGLPFKICAELGDLVVGNATGRVSEEEVTIFKPVGMAFEDVVSARIVVDRVRNENAVKKTDWD